MPTAMDFEPVQITWHGLFVGERQIDCAEGKPRILN